MQRETGVGPTEKHVAIMSQLCRPDIERPASVSLAIRDFSPPMAGFVNRVSDGLRPAQRDQVPTF